MAEAVLDSKDPRKVAAGHAGVRARWGPPRRLNIGDLTGPQREVVLGLIEAQRIANAAVRRDDGPDALTQPTKAQNEKDSTVIGTPVESSAEVRRGSVDSAV